MSAATRVPGEDLGWPVPIAAFGIGCACAATSVALIIGAMTPPARAEPSQVASTSPVPAATQTVVVVVPPVATTPVAAAIQPAVCSPVVVEFDYAREAVPSAAAPELKRLAGWLVQNPGTSLLLEGHADARGSEDENLALSKHRASNVAGALALQGVDKNRITARGLGAFQPKEGVPESAAVNRRVVAFIKGTTACPKLMEGSGK